ncbi:hypothetical protein Tco_1072113 [Tanacetum coccineum]
MISSLSLEILGTLETSSTSLIHEDTQVYGTILPKELTNQAMLESKSYKIYYAFASGEKTPKPKYVRKKVDSEASPKPVQATKGTRLKSKAKVAKSDKKKKPANMPKAKGLEVLSKVALTEVEQLKLATKRSKTQFHSSHASGSGDGVDTQSKVPDEHELVSYQSEETESNNDGDDLTHPNLSTYEAEDQEEEKADDEEVSSDQRVYTPPDYELTNEEENQEGDDKVKEGEEEQEEEDELYRDLLLNLERSDAEMTNAQQENVQANQVTEDTYVILTHVPPTVQHQSSSVSSDLVSKFINTSPDTGIDSILNQNIQSHNPVNVPVFVAAETPSSETTTPQPPIPNTQLLQ